MNIIARPHFDASTRRPIVIAALHSPMSSEYRLGQPSGAPTVYLPRPESLEETTNAFVHLNRRRLAEKIIQLRSVRRAQ